MEPTTHKYHAGHTPDNGLFPHFEPLTIKLLSSEDLFGNSNEILIQHRNEQYRLRLTRNNKLILTK
ncbi:hypothetical protein Nstercoris_00596 [Nitrosomonas stercoris]|uniref:Hemin uptake protein HemP n=1 Tax=Nitrosomonas stercoris TaxID=1444684 RepID=A0A4Y1YQV2_9PROT|nr:hypothetical protein Nstercoris_00596 [Nitrosomonas stercoris]